MIVENKGLQANLILDEGCRLQTTETTPLVKIINYFINFLQQYSSAPLEISLDLLEGKYLLSFVAFSDRMEIDAPSAQLDEALNGYQAAYKLIHEKGRYIQVKIQFNH